MKLKGYVRPQLFGQGYSAELELEGPTLRDRFAAAALAGFALPIGDGPAGDGWPDLLVTAARDAYRVADAMLAARENLPTAADSGGGFLPDFEIKPKPGTEDGWGYRIVEHDPAPPTATASGRVVPVVELDADGVAVWHQPEAATPTTREPILTDGPPLPAAAWNPCLFDWAHPERGWTHRPGCRCDRPAPIMEPPPPMTPGGALLGPPPGPPPTHRETLLRVIRSLEAAPRQGTDQDVPEGERWIQVSDTLTLEWARTLRGVLPHVSG